MKVASKFMGGLLAVLLVCTAIALVIGFLWTLWQAPATVVVPVLGALIAVIGALGLKWVEQRNAVREARRVQQSAMYQEFVTTVLDQFARSPHGLDEAALRKFFYEFTPKLIIHGSPSFIRAWNKLKTMGAEGADPIGITANMFLAIRKDLGHPAPDVAPKELLQTFINDLD
jgi:hypothetical protein